MDTLTILIPARNEAACLGDTVMLLQAITEGIGLPVTVLVVNDGSTDETAAVARAAGVSVIDRRGDPGYGSALNTGLAAVTTPRLTIMTADGSDSPYTLQDYATRSGLVFGNRWDEAPRDYPPLKRVVNRLGNHWIGQRRRLPYFDWTDPFKAYPTALAKSCLPLPNDMSAGLALALRASKQTPFTVVPTFWRDRQQGQSKFRWQEPLYYLRTAWRDA